MTTYVALGPEIFQSEWKPRELENLHRKRSHARLKAYASCDDLRAWSCDPEIRRRHLFHIINTSKTGYGNYIPVLELVKVLGVPEAGLLLNDALQKLNELSTILGIKDHRHPELTDSERDFRLLCYASGGECKEDDTVRNLRCLVGELYERTKEMERLKCERDALKSALDSSQTTLEEEASTRHLETTCLRMRVEQFEGIDERMRGLMSKYDAALKELRELRRCNAELMETNRKLNEADEKELFRQREEIYSMCKAMKILQEDNTSLNQEVLELRCAVQDQEDEISRLTNYTDTLTKNADCKQEQMRYVLNEMQLELNDKVKELEAARVEMMESKQYITELTELRDQMRRVIDALTDNKQYFRAAWDHERKRADQLEAESSMDLLALLKDPDIGCDVMETVTSLSKDALTKLINTAKDLDEENRKLCCKLECYRKHLETKIEELRQTYVALDQCREEAEYLRSEIARLEPYVSFKAKAEEFERKLMDCTDDKNCLTGIIGTLKAEAAEQQKAYNEIKAENIRLQEAASLGQKVFKMKEEMKLLKDRIKKIDDERRAALVSNKECEKMKKEICTLKCGLAQCQESLKACKFENEGLTALVEDLEDENKECNKKNINLKKEHDLMKEALNDLGQRLTDKKDELKKCECQNRGLKSKLQKAIDANESQKEEIADLNKCLEISEKATADAIKRTEEAEMEGARRAADLEDQNRSLQDLIKMTPSPAECDAKLCAAECKQHEAEAKAREMELSLLEAVNKAKYLEKELSESEEREVAAMTELGKCQQEVAKLYADIEDMQTNMKMQDNTLKAVCGTTEECKDYIFNLKAQVKQLELDKRGIKAELEACKRQKQNLCMKIKECREELNSLSVRHSAMERDYDECKKNLTASYAYSDCAKKDIDKLTMENNKLMEKLRLALAEAQAAREESKKLQQSLKDLEAIYESVQEAMVNVQAASQRGSGDTEMSAAEEQALKNSLAAQEQLADAQKENEILNETIENLQNEMNDLKGLNEVLTEKLEEEKEKNRALQVQVDQLNMELNKANMDLRSAKEEINKLRLLIESLQDTLADKNAEIENLKNVKDCMETELITVRKMQTKDRDTINALREQITALDAANADLKAEVIQTSNDNVTLGNLVDTLTFELTECKGKIAQMENDIRNLLGIAKELTYTRTQVENLQVLVDNTEKQLKSEKDKVRACNAEMNATNERWAAAEKKTVEIEKSLITEQNDKKAVKAQLDKARKEVSKLEKEYNNLRDSNLQLMNNISLLKNKIAELEFKIAEKDSGSDDDKIIAMQTAEINSLRKKLEELGTIKNGLEFQVSQIKIEMDGAKAIADRMKEEVGILLTENSEMKEDLGKYKFMSEDFERRLDIAENTVDLLTRENGKLRSNFELLNQQNDINESTITTLKDEVDSMTLKMKDLQGLVNRGNAMETVYVNKIENQKNTIKDLTMVRVRLEKQLSLSEDEVSKQKATIDSMNGKIMNLLAVKSDLENELLTRERDLKNFETEVNRAQQSISNCNAKFSATSTEKQRLDTEVRQLRESNNDAVDRISDLLISLSEEQAKNSNLLLEKNDLQASLDRAYFDLNHTMKDLSVEKDLLMKANEDGRAKQEQLENCRRNLTLTQNDLITCKKNSDDLVSDNSTLRIEVKELDRKLTKTQDQLAECEETVNKLKSENDNLTRALSKVTAQFEKELAVNDMANKEIQSLETKISTLLLQIKALKESLGDMKEECDSLRKDKENLERNISSLESQINSLKKQIHNLGGDMKEQNKKIVNLEDEITSLQSLMVARDESIKKLKVENKKFKTENQVLSHDKAGLEKIKSGLENELHTLKNNLKLTTYNLESVKAKLEEVSQEKSKLSTEMVAKKAEIAGLSESISKIKEILIKTQELQNQLEMKVRDLEEKKNEILEELQDEKRKNEMATTTVATLENALREETADRREKINEISKLKEQAKKMERKMKESDFEILDLKEEAQTLKTEITNLTSIIRDLQKGAPADTNLNKILQKIIATGWDTCDLAELGEIHEAVVAATDALVSSGKAKPAKKAPVVAVDPKPPSMPEDKKKYLLMLAPLHRQLMQGEEAARKRTCALNATVQKYQHELYALRHWDLEMSKKLDDVHGMSREQQELLRKQSCYQQSRISHYLDVACKEKQMAESYDCAVRQALGKINAMQKAVITDQMEQYQAQVTECLRSKLKASEQTGRNLSCELAQERQKSACLQRCATKPRPPEPLPPFEPQKQTFLTPVPQVPPQIPPRLQCPPKDTDPVVIPSLAQAKQEEAMESDCPCKTKVSFCDKVETRYFEKESR